MRLKLLADDLVLPCSCDAMRQDFSKTEAIVADMRRYLHTDSDFDHELHQFAGIESLDHFAVNIVVHCHTSAGATREYRASLS